MEGTTPEQEGESPSERLRQQLDLSLFDDLGPGFLSVRRTVLFLPSGRRVRVEHDWNVFEVAQAAGEYIPTSCGGKGTCGCCRVRVEGAVRAPVYAERQFIDAVDLALGVRLACRLHVHGEIQVWTRW